MQDRAWPQRYVRRVVLPAPAGSRAAGGTRAPAPPLPRPPHSPRARAGSSAAAPALNESGQGREGREARTFPFRRLRDTQHSGGELTDRRVLQPGGKGQPGGRGSSERRAAEPLLPPWAARGGLRAARLRPAVGLPASSQRSAPPRPALSRDVRPCLERAR